jgi:hypothetical protein
MGFGQKMELAAVALLGCAAVPSAAAPQASAPPEPLVVTTLPDPDPNYVPRDDGRGEPALEQRHGLDLAIEEFGRAISQAALLQQEAIAAKCRSGAPPEATASERFAWEASCRYSRR